MKIQMFGAAIFMFFNLESSDHCEILTWIQTVLVPRKMDRMFVVSDANRVDFLKKSYQERTFEDISFIRNDIFDITNRTSFVHYYNPDSVGNFDVKQDAKQVVIKSSLALKHVWRSSEKIHCFYYLLRESNFESCPVSNFYEELSMAVEQIEKN